LGILEILVIIINVFRNSSISTSVLHLCLRRSMNDYQKILTAGKCAIDAEAQALRELGNSLSEGFVSAVQRIAACDGQVVVSGIGKSAIIAQKMVATFISTGQPAVFMHAADALHGDLGAIRKADVVMVISKSGESPEIKALIPLIKTMGNTLIGIHSNAKSALAEMSDTSIEMPDSPEACPNNLAPTSSSTAQMALGDAMAVALMDLRGFGASDFARFHPGGALGKKLYLNVAALLRKNASPQVSVSALASDIINSITAGRLGATAVTEGGELLGIITDGDIRRMLERSPEEWRSWKAEDIMSKSPKFISPETLAIEAFSMMEAHHITTLPVVSDQVYVGMIHLHDILKEGIY
jgi:arabinose-5-phosphate isomerase